MTKGPDTSESIDAAELGERLTRARERSDELRRRL